MNKKLMYLYVVGIFFLLYIMTQLRDYQVMAVEKQVEGGEGTHSKGQNHLEAENGGSYSPLNPEEAKTYSSPNGTIPTANNLSIASLITEGSPIIGNPSAPITIIEFGDFQCEFCARFAKVTEPNINATYIQTGKANMVFKHFITHGEDSSTAAIASQCANEQGQFWKLYEMLYHNQGPENSGWAKTDNMKKFASKVPGLDMKEFVSCMDTQKYKSLVDNDMALAVSLGLQGTPSFIIVNNDGSKPETLLGAQPFPAFQSILDKKF
jgi:protein-disulfide isomerase